MADLERELKKVRDEAAQRRVELSPFKKAFGNFQKIGSRKFIDVLTPAEEPKNGPGNDP
jgi:hypothetical protein